MTMPPSHHRLLLTGAAGGLGQALRGRLKANCQVLRLSDVADLGVAQAGEEIFTADLADAAAVQAMMAGVDARPLDICSVIYVAARLLYIFCYVKDLATARSIFWVVGYASVIALFVFGFQMMA
jgi:NAD(P)-dependent dehydrogenase (short-subunit alcohol dehydrogenase family)